MSENITINLTQPKEEIKFSYTEQGEDITFSFSEAARGPQGPTGPAATVDQTIIDGSTNAVSGNAVFDGLALKAPIANPTFTGIVTAPRITGRCDGLEVLCKAGLAINAGQVVYVTGAAGNNIIIGLAQANTELTSSKTIGISESTLAHNATGYAITEGLLTVSISAPSAVEGDPIWLSATTAGGMVFGLANKPSAPNHIVYLGVVTRKTGNTVVEIYVKIQNGAELDELADVAITSPVAGQALMRGASLWENRSLVSADISDAKSSGAGAADAGKLVEFGSQGEVAFSGVDTANAITGSSSSGRGALLTSNSGIGATIASTSGTGATISGGSGLNHVQFGGSVGNNRSFVRTVLGLFGWHRGSFVQTLGSPATLTADSAIELPDIASGTVALTSDEMTPSAAGLTSKFGTNKASIVNGDKVTILDSAASDAPKHVLWSLIVSTLTTAFDALYVGLTGNQTVAGNKTLSGQLELTGQAATNSTSAMSRDLVATLFRNCNQYIAWQSYPQGFFATGTGGRLVGAQLQAGSIHYTTGTTAGSTSGGNSGGSFTGGSGAIRDGNSDTTTNFTIRHAMYLRIHTRDFTNGTGWIYYGGTFNNAPAANPTAPCFGVKLDGTSLKIITHNGTTFNESASLLTMANRTVYEVIVISDGSGNVSLLRNNSVIGTITGGPTTSFSTPTVYPTVIQSITNNASTSNCTLVIYNCAIMAGDIY